MRLIGICRFVLLAFTSIIASGSIASASTTVNWTGGDNFDHATITFAAFKANVFTDILGDGQYEGCCSNVPTNFTLQLKLSDAQFGPTTWTTVLTWSATGDNTKHDLDDLLPTQPGNGVIELGKDWVSGIRLMSNPNGGFSDPNFTDFYFVTYMTQQEYYNKYKYKYPSWDYFIHCGDYENYVKHYTKFVFDYVEPPPHGPPDVPVPGALPLFVSGVGLFGGLLYRRNRKQARG